MADRRPSPRPGGNPPPRRQPGGRPSFGGPPRRPAAPRAGGPVKPRAAARKNDAPEGADRLQKVLAHAGLGSRRACEEMIQQGRVTINGEVARELGVKVDPDHATIHVDGQKVRMERHVYFAVHKPKGYVSTNHDPAGKPLVVDLLAEVPQRVYTVGRLDEQSTGLMLLTNDGDLANKLAHPKFGVEKIYRVVVAGEPGPEVFDQLTKGVWLAEGKVRAKRVRVVGRKGQASVLEMILAEGKNREIRRMLAKFGHKVMSLTRIAVGPIGLKGLSVGEVRTLSGRELDLLRMAADGKPVPSPKFPDRRPRVPRPGEVRVEGQEEPEVRQDRGPYRPQNQGRPAAPPAAPRPPRPTGPAQGPGPGRRFEQGQGPGPGRRFEQGQGPAPGRRFEQGQGPGPGRRFEQGPPPGPQQQRGRQFDQGPPQRPGQRRDDRPAQGEGDGPRPAYNQGSRPAYNQGPRPPYRQGARPSFQGDGQGPRAPQDERGPRPPAAQGGPRPNQKPGPGGAHRSSTPPPGGPRPIVPAPEEAPKGRRILGMGGGDQGYGPDPEGPGQDGPRGARLKRPVPKRFPGAALNRKRPRKSGGEG